TMALHVIVGLRLKRFDQHPPGALARDLIQRQKLLTGFPRSRLLDYLQHRWRPPSTRLPPGFALLTQKGTPPFSCRLDPQLLVIAPSAFDTLLSRRLPIDLTTAPIFTQSSSLSGA